MAIIIFFLSIIGAFFSDGNWPEYLGGKDRNHYSTLTQINAKNLQDLEIAWTYQTEKGQMQVNPLVVDGKLYAVNAAVQAVALDAATGKEIWKFGDPLKAWHSTSRGVAYWADGNDKRILHSIGPNLYALDANTGQPITSFGDNGKIDLHTGLPAIAKEKFIISNTPGTIYKDLIMMPVRLSEGEDAAPGDLRAFNVRTGKLAWTFHTIPYPGEEGYKTFPKNAYKNTEIGAANNWAGMAVDESRGIVYIPTGSAAYDFYGGNRAGKNLYGNCLLALDANTGKKLWHFQFTHHDIWDRDLPAPPNLVTLNIKGKKVEAVAQTTKQGYVYVFDRVSGKPLFDIREIPFPKSGIPGEKTWPTQPIPTEIPSFSRQSKDLTENDISPYAENKTELLERFRSFKKGLYDPPSTVGTLLMPGYDGGAEWGGAAVTPGGIMYVNSNEMAWVLTMKPAPKKAELATMTPGQRVYTQQCQTCHGKDRAGNPASNYPALNKITKTKSYVSDIISKGKGMMPGFANIKGEQKQALIDFLFDIEKKEISGGANESAIPFLSTGYHKFLDSKGLPAIGPPWGQLTAIDLNTGKFLWQKPHGFEPELKNKGILNTGCENYGGAIATANGLLMIAGTKDGMFRIIDQKTGDILWERELPAASFATPTTYMAGGKQYIVLACGGTKLGTKVGDSFVAFALK